MNVPAALTQNDPPRTWQGITVPFVAMWDDERDQTSAYDPLVRAVAGFPMRPAGGHPVFGIMEPSRQRRAMVNQLCQVCGKRLGRWRWSPALGRRLKDPQQVPGDGLLRMEPPACFYCAAVAARTCPGMMRARPTWDAVGQAKLVLQQMNGASMRASPSERYFGVPKIVVQFVEYVVSVTVESLTHEQFLERTVALVNADELDAMSHALRRSRR